MVGELKHEVGDEENLIADIWISIILLFSNYHKIYFLLYDFIFVDYNNISIVMLKKVTNFLIASNNLRLMGAFSSHASIPTKLQKV